MRRAHTSSVGDKASPDPPALWFLILVEGWERFSFYGMQSLLALYVSGFLLNAEHVGHISGLVAFRTMLEHVYGPLSAPAFASAIFGLYAGGVYLTPLAGGLIADRLLGRTATVVLGAVLITIGHFLMAGQSCFLLALAVLLAGVGCFKGNLAAQLGELYQPLDPRRTDAFQMYLLGVNVAAIGAPLVCGTLGERVGWSWGFAAAGVAMLAGLATYLIGLRWLPGSARPGAPPRQTARSEVALNWPELCLLGALLVGMTLAETGNVEVFNAYIVWGAQNFDLAVLGRNIPATWLLSLDSAVSTVVLALCLGLWRWLAQHGTQLHDVAKLQIGTAIAAMAPLLLAAASAWGTGHGHKISLAWALAFHATNAIGIANVFPAGLALFTRVAPAALNGMATSLFFLHLFAANMIVGWLGGQIEHLGYARFWLVHFLLIGMGGSILLVIGAGLSGRLGWKYVGKTGAGLRLS